MYIRVKDVGRLDNYSDSYYIKVRKIMGTIDLSQIKFARFTKRV